MLENVSDTPCRRFSGRHRTRLQPLERSKNVARASRFARSDGRRAKRTLPAFRYPIGRAATLRADSPHLAFTAMVRSVQMVGLDQGSGGVFPQIQGTRGAVLRPV